MKDGKVFYLLKQLTVEEFKELKRAINSPFFNTNKRLLKLYQALRPDYPNFTDSEKYRRKLYKKVYPREAFNIDKQYKLFTAFCRLTEEYLLFSNLRNQPLKLKKLKTELYAKRQMKPYFESETKALATQLEASPYRDLEHYENQIFLNNALYFNSLKDKYDLKDQSLDNLVDALDRYFVLAKMRYGISVKSRERILTKPGIWRFTEAMENEADFMKGSLLFQLYKFAFSMLGEEADFSFEDYEALLFEHIDEFRDDSRILFFSGLNYVNRQVNKGGFEFSKKALEWYCLGLDKELLLEDGNLSEVTYGNIVIFGCREAKFEWTEQFMKQYALSLKESIREDVFKYHLGLWNFYQKRFDSVLNVYFNHQFSAAYIPKTRLTTIRALFELFLNDRDYFDLLNSTIKAHEIFITRDKKFVNQKWIPHLNFIRIIRKVAKMIMENESQELIYDSMVQLISSSPKIVAKQWLIEKVNRY